MAPDYSNHLFLIDNIKKLMNLTETSGQGLFLKKEKISGCVLFQPSWVEMEIAQKRTISF